MSNNSLFSRQWQFAAYILVACNLISCQQRNDAQEIIDKSIEKHGGGYYHNVLVSFDFRGRHYTINKEDGGQFEYTRGFSDSLGTYLDVYNNDGFKRILNDAEIQIADTMAAKYMNSVNSVVYFATIPFVLNDGAVMKEYLGICSIKDEKYHKIEISFREEGGGKDFDDVFVYWINAESYTVDYFAYEYSTDGGGRRFREVLNRRRVGEILFSDHINYKYDSEDTDITEFDQLYEDNQLEELSRIVLENIQVEPI